MKKMVWYWLIAVVITLVAAYYQKVTGPTYPAKIDYRLGGSQYHAKLDRSHPGTTDCPVTIAMPDTAVAGELFYRHYPSGENYIQVPMIHKGKELTAMLPNQPPAGKLQYYIKLQKGDEQVELGTQKPVIIRYRGDVPALIIIPHALLMFIAMLLANLAGALAIGNMPSFRKYTLYTLICLLFGGLILGPIVQKYAFGAFWTGVPYGFDLTDNKTLIGFIFVLLAVLGNLKKERRHLTILAAIVILVVYSIPHSMFGSELNYETGKVIQGFINLHWMF